MKTVKLNKKSYIIEKLKAHNEHLEMQIKELKKAYKLLVNDTYKIHYKYLKFKNLITCEKDCGKLEISPDEKICLSCGSGLKLK